MTSPGKNSLDGEINSWKRDESLRKREQDEVKQLPQEADISSRNNLWNELRVLSAANVKMDISSRYMQ